MRKIFKMFISNVLALSIIFSMLYGTAYADIPKADQSKLISIKDYEDAMSKIYAQYEIEWKIVDSSDTLPITRALFDSEIARAKEECRKYQAEINKNKRDFVIQNLTNTQTVIQDIGVYSVMPVTRNISASYTATFAPFCSCTLSANANVTYDVNYDIYMYLNSWSIIKSSAVNCEAWVDKGSSVTFNSGKTSCYANFVGECYFSYTIPVVNVKVDQTVPVDAHYVMS